MLSPRVERRKAEPEVPWSPGPPCSQTGAWENRSGSLEISHNANSPALSRPWSSGSVGSGDTEICVFFKSSHGDSFPPKKRLLLPLAHSWVRIISWAQSSWVGRVPGRACWWGPLCRGGEGASVEGGPGFASTTQNSMSGLQFPPWAPGRARGKSSPSRCVNRVGIVAWPSPRGPPSQHPALSPPHSPPKLLSLC